MTVRERQLMRIVNLKGFPIVLNGCRVCACAKTHHLHHAIVGALTESGSSHPSADALSRFAEQDLLKAQQACNVSWNGSVVVYFWTATSCRSHGISWSIFAPPFRFAPGAAK